MYAIINPYMKLEAIILRIAMFQLGRLITEANMMIMVLLRFLLACSVIGLIAGSFLRTIVSGFLVAQKMHQIPCTNCRFFTNDYRLKCTAQPYIANTEEAIHCLDYQSRSGYHLGE